MSNFFDRKYAASSAALVVINGDADYTRANCFMEKEEEVKMHNRTMPIGKNGNLRKILSLALAFCICLSLVTALGGTKVQAASTKMTRLEFIKEVVKALENEMSYTGSKFKGAKLTIVNNKSGKITVGDKDTTALKIKAYKTKFNVSLEDAQTIGAAISLGLMKATTFTTVKKNIKRSEAAIIMAKAHELVYGANNRPDTDREITDEDIKLAINERITDIKKIKLSANKTWFAKAYLYGFIKGSSDGQYTHSRTFKPGAYPTKSTLTGMIDMLLHTDKRAKLSYDWQVCRTTKLPRNAELYPYIIDSIPNGYYETGFNGFGTKEFFTTGIGTRTVSEMLSAQYGGDWLRPAYIAEFNALEYPWKDKSFIRIGREYMPENRNNDIVKGLVESSVEFYTYALNVNYKTIKKDKEWRSVMSKYLTDAQIDEYIEHCIENKTIIECDNVGADVSGVYWFEGAYDCKVYAHVRFVSDIPLENKKDNDNEYGTLFPIRRGHILGDRYSRLLLFGYMDYKMGTWIDYYFNTEADPDGPGYLDTSLTTIYDIMINQSGAYPWLLKFD